ncbi:hypothetical protein [Piscinibacter koreensis]|uniref:Uncharacterized protein n=1 Tax=Piscinibacter koreensis TaxID=2742824 RepID=A0A7Y6NRL9_9BURK|nr:hypothetical protein [Schlegelella koreensis]NUZ08065.1 hypothetical protein [Schlegelella koreensis]
MPALVACLGFVLCGAAGAADSHRHEFSDVVTETYDGTWTATFEPGLGATGTAKLVLKDFAGTWSDVGAANRLKGTACGGKPMPVTIQMSQKEQFGFTVFGVSVAPQCPNLTVSLNRTGENTLEGTVESSLTEGEKKIRLVRVAQASRKR